MITENDFFNYGLGKFQTFTVVWQGKKTNVYDSRGKIVNGLRSNSCADVCGDSIQMIAGKYLPDDIKKQIPYLFDENGKRNGLSTFNMDKAIKAMKTIGIQIEWIGYLPEYKGITGHILTMKFLGV